MPPKPKVGKVKREHDPEPAWEYVAPLVPQIIVIEVSQRRDALPGMQDILNIINALHACTALQCTVLVGAGDLDGLTFDLKWSLIAFNGLSLQENWVACDLCQKWRKLPKDYIVAEDSQW